MYSTETNLQMNTEFKKFGLMMGVALFVVGTLKVIQSPYPGIFYLIVASVFTVLSLFVPGLLRPAYGLWMKIGSVLGYINSKIIFTLVFLIVIIPLSFVLKLFKVKFLDLSFDKNMKSYATEYQKRDDSHFSKPY